MSSTRMHLAVLVALSALALAACGGGDLTTSPVAADVVGGETALFTASGNGPGNGGVETPAGDGICDGCDGTCDGTGPHGPGNGTGDGTCDGTAQGPGPYGGNGPGDGLCGDACTGPVGPDPADISTMLVNALQEEYKAQYLYASVLEDYPGAMPFGTIVESEMRHVEALKVLFTRREMTPPASNYGPWSFDPLPSLQAACAKGVTAEQEDAEFYVEYLGRTDLPQDVQNVFTNLQAASLESHLPAFERCQ